MSENECSGPILPLFPPSGVDAELLANARGPVFTLSSVKVFALDLTVLLFTTNNNCHHVFLVCSLHRTLLTPTLI